MQFYRVCHESQMSEDDYGTPYYVGPYVGDVEGLRYRQQDALSETLWPHNFDDEHPSMRTDLDPEPFDLGDFVCGFTTLAGMEHWFAGCWEVLSECGFVVRWWPDVDENMVRLGDYQAGCLISELDARPSVILD